MQQSKALQIIGLLISIGSFIYGLINYNTSISIVGGMMGFTFLIMLVVCSNFFNTIKQPKIEVVN